MSDLSELIGLKQRYTNHSIRVTGITNLTRSHYTPRQVMSITGHKSIQSLSIYQRVKEDEKMMMGMSLIYSLFRPSDVNRVLNECSPHFEVTDESETAQLPQQNMLMQVPQQTRETPVPLAVAPQSINTNQTIQNATNTVVTENAITPYVPQQSEVNALAPPAQIEQFDFLKFLCDDDDNELVMAATQVENQLELTEEKSVSTTKASKSVVKKNTSNPMETLSVGSLVRSAP